MGIRTAPPNLIRNGEEKLSSIDLGDCYWVDHTWLFGTTWHGFQDINNILNAGEAGSNDLVDSKMAFRHWLWMTMAVFVRVLHWSTRDAKLKIIPIPEAPLEQGVTTNCGMLSVQQMKTETGSVVCGTKTLVKKDEKWHSTPSVPCFPVFFFASFPAIPSFKKVPNLFPNDEIDRVIADTRPRSPGQLFFTDCSGWWFCSDLVDEHAEIRAVYPERLPLGNSIRLDKRLRSWCSIHSVAQNFWTSHLHKLQKYCHLGLHHDFKVCCLEDLWVAKLIQ